MFSNILGGAASFPVADLGDTIAQSLRFTKDQYLSRTPSSAGNRRKFTYSGWAKIADPSDLSMLFSAWGGSSVNAFELYFLNTANGNGLQVYQWNGSSYDATYVTSNKFRDAAAWYHIVMAVDTEQSDQANRMRLWVNNLEVSFSTNTQFSQNTDTYVNTTQVHRIGNSSYDTTSNRFDGYMAEVYFLDGQYLAPTDFGRYNEDGVWVPKNYTGGSYGTNGFHLTFDSSQTNGIGHDSSGNGNNFTATGFDTAAVALYSKDLFTSTNTSINVNSTDTNFAGGSGQEFAFDGNTALASNTSATSNSAIVFRPSTPISNVTQIEVNYSAAVSGTIAGYNGGNETSAAASGYNQIYSGSAITVNNIYVRNSNQTFLAAIRINGSTVLTDNTDNDVDFNDTPTSNYATLNPLFNAADHTPRYFGITKDANLAADTSGSEADYATTSNIELTDGKWYFEVTYTTRALVGIAGGLDRQNNRAFIEAETGNYTTQNSFGTSGPTSNSGSQTSGTIGCRVDITNRTLAFTWDGSTYTSNLTYSDPGHKIFPYISAGAAQPSNNTIQINHGQMPFIYTVPTGFEGALQTNNLPEPTIKNGKDHFGIVTWTGDGTSGRDITGLNFQPDFVWMKARSSAYYNRLYDVIRGINVSLVSDANFIDGLNIPSLTAFNSDGFEIGTETDYNQSNETYVAWCWKGGGTAVSNTDGTVTSSVSANTDAGFSIVSYTGGGDASTVGHGLDRAPEFILFKAREQVGGTDQNWNVYHHSVGNNQVGFLNLTNAFTSDDFLNSTTPTSSVIEFGTSNSVSASGADYIAYCWHSVEGFSKFGSYQGNGSTDGPVIVTGFRPAFVLVKRTTGTTGNWVMFDTARSPNNPVNEYLTANDAQAEFGASNAFDIVSNGFKLRGDWGSANTSGAPYVYMAFAENPFGGENTAPATAR